MPKRRAKKTRPLGSVLHIFCEGEKTEPNYIKSYVGKTHPENRLLVKVQKCSKNTPVQLVREAVNLKNHKDTPDGDHFWVVYDRESTSQYKDSLHRDAFEHARREDINIAISNVCFEIWLLLHFTDSTAPYGDYTNLMKNSPLKKELKKLGLGDYQKSNSRLYNLISDRVQDARKRAITMNRNTLNSSDESKGKPYRLNPYTLVHELLDGIDEFVKKNRPA